MQQNWDHSVLNDGTTCDAAFCQVLFTFTAVCRLYSEFRFDPMLKLYFAVGEGWWREQFWYRGQEVPGCFFWVLPKRSIPKPDSYGKDIIQRESLCSDML